MKLTNSLKLKKPDGSDFYDVENFNYNADVIDEELEKVNSQIGQKLDKDSNFYADIEAYHGNTKLIDDFQDISGWTVSYGTILSDTVNIKIGSQALKMIENDNIEGDLMIYRNTNLDLSKLNNGEVSVDNDYVLVVLFISDLTKISSKIQILFSNGINGDTTNYKSYSASVGTLQTGWNFLKIKKSVFVTGGIGAWSGIQSVRLSWRSLANAQNAYVSFQLIQLVKKDILEDKPNPFQNFGVRDFEISNGEWFVGKEFGEVILKPLSTTTSYYSLLTNLKFVNFNIGMNVELGNNNSKPITWFINQSNFISACINNNLLFVRIVENNSTTDFTAPLSIVGTIGYISIQKSSNKVTIKATVGNNIATIKKEFNRTDAGVLALGINGKNADNTISASITEISHAHHSDVAEVAKRLSSNHYSNPNLLINGDFQVWQRGTVFNIGKTIYQYTADRWYVLSSMDAAKVEKDGEFAKLTAVTVGSGTDFSILQGLETVDVIPLRGKKITFSVNLKKYTSMTSGDIILNIYTGTGIDEVAAGTGRIITTKKISYSELSTEPKLFTITADVPTNTNSLCVVIRVGTIFGNKINNGGSFGVKSAKLELGEIATPLSPRPYGEELALCQRYYKKISGTLIPRLISADGRSLIFDLSEFVSMRPTKTFVNLLPHNTFTLYNVYGMNAISWGSTYTLRQTQNAVVATSTVALTTPTEQVRADFDFSVEAEIY